MNPEFVTECTEGKRLFTGAENFLHRCRGCNFSVEAPECFAVLLLTLVLLVNPCQAPVGLSRRQRGKPGTHPNILPVFQAVHPQRVIWCIHSGWEMNEMFHGRKIHITVT